VARFATGRLGDAEGKAEDVTSEDVEAVPQPRLYRPGRVVSVGGVYRVEAPLGAGGMGEVRVWVFSGPPGSCLLDRPVFSPSRLLGAAAGASAPGGGSGKRLCCRRDG
jgi:hypothetical protein